MYSNTRNRNRGFNNRRRFSRSNGSSNKTHSSMYVNKAVDTVEAPTEVISNRFEDFNFSLSLFNQIKQRGYNLPTPIQDKAIPVIKDGRDVIGIADTGTGKTAAFLLPLLNKHLTDSSNRTLIIVPTRELAVQIDSELKAFTKGMGIYSALCIGGNGFGPQISALRRNPDFIIGTPGRLKDHFNKRNLRLVAVNNLVLDEADRMVEMGFIEDVRFLVSAMPSNRQSLFFSATITPQVQRLFAEFTINPETISVKNRDTSQNVEQDVIRYTDAFHRMSQLHELLNKEEVKKVLIFGRTKHGVENLSTSLRERGFKVSSLHGNKNQSQRLRALNELKNDDIQVLVATDVAARGLDIPNVSHVINFDVPENYADYVHRIGRTGRGNNKGIAYTFVPFGR